MAKYSCTSACANESFTTTDLDKTTNYALFGLNNNSINATVTGASVDLCNVGGSLQAYAYVAEAYCVRLVCGLPSGDITITEAYGMRTVPMFIESTTVGADDFEVIAGVSKLLLPLARL